MPKDYYIILGVSRGADLNKIKKAYRTIAKQYHPDVAGSKENREKFLEVKEAYETLGDKAKRKEYDQKLAKQGSSLRVSDVPNIINTRTSYYDEIDRFFSTDVDDFFEGFLPGFFDFQKGRLKEKDLFFETILSPQEAQTGGIYPITVPVIIPCPRCAKSGFWEDFFCPVCSGYGRVKSEREFSLTIPPGVKHGTQIQLSLEDIGLRDTLLNILVTIDPHQEKW